jgi:DNA helicase TIP49 (TBP-interacting protein)
MPVGTNPWYIYKLPFDTSEVAKARLLIKQRDGLKIKMTETDAVMEGNVIRFRLSQEDTFRLNAQLPAERQLRIKTKAGDLFKTKPVTYSLNRCLDMEVL